MTTPLTFVVPVGDDTIYERYFNSSPLFTNRSNFEIYCQRGFTSAAAAFNAAIDTAQNDLLVFCHQDIVLPAAWAVNFSQRIDELEYLKPQWGVVGCAGQTREEQLAAHLYRHDRELCGVVPLPASVRTLDECIICFRRSSGLRFDESLAWFFFYAVDICMQAEARGLQSYVVDSPCFHQAKNRISLPASFYRAEQLIIRKWRDRLPIQTLSGRVAGNGHLARKKLRNAGGQFLATFGYRRRPWWVGLPRILPEKLVECGGAALGCPESDAQRSINNASRQ